MTASARILLNNVIGREIGSERHCWSVLDDLFDVWPHVMAAAAIALTALNTSLMGEPAYLGWSLVALVAQLVSRVVTYSMYTSRKDRDALDVWLKVFWIAATSSGLLWGVSLSLLLVDATPGARVTILTVGCVMVQAASARAYMAPLPAISQSAILLSLLLAVTVAQGDMLMIPICILFVLFQVAYIRRLIGLRLSQMASEAEKNVLLAKLEQTNGELRDANERLARHALTDGLTGLPNRRHFDRSLRDQLARANRDDLPLSLVLIDVDHFKRFNDTYGHLAGDTCLSAVGKAMLEHGIRQNDLVARYGGEEFALLLPGADPETARAVAESVRCLIAGIDFSHLPGQPKGVTASFGIASKAASQWANEEELIALADAALYVAKKDGRNCIRHANDLLHRRQTQRA